jgi:hypothetical protein
LDSIHRQELTACTLKGLLAEHNLATNKADLIECLVNFSNDPSAWDMYIPLSFLADSGLMDFKACTGQFPSGNVEEEI